jgi:decaprenyl-phosphate phosphoribosyltransferase
VTARPRQWVKNLLVFAAPGTAGVLSQPTELAKTVVAFVAFCAAASAMYFVNDVRDRRHDAAHPVKRHRPVAAGDLAPVEAWLAATVLIAVAFVISFAGAGLPLTGALCTYVVLALAYTFWLRDIVLVDVATVAGLFVVRAAAGGLAVGVYLSTWFLIVASFGALFIATGKRFAEHRALGTGRGAHRKALDQYPEPLLRSMLTSSSAVTITAYCLWAFEGEGSRNPFAALSIIPFVLGLFRYSLLGEAGSGGAPEEVLLTDRGLQIACLSWLTLVGIGVYLA